MHMHMQKKIYLSFERGDLLPILLMTPALLLIIFVMVIPLLCGMVLSLCNYSIGSFNFSKDFIGLSNYIKLFRDQTALKSIVNTLIFSAGAIAGDMILGTVIAVLVFRLCHRAASVVRPVITIPLLVSPIIVGLIWRYIYDPQGILYWFLSIFKLGIANFPGVTSQKTALLSVIIAHWWEVVPFVIIVLTAGLVSIPQELYEAAYVDGAGSFRAFQKITLPMLTNVYMVIILISGVDTIKVFDIIYSLTSGGPNNSTVSINGYAFTQGFVNSNMGYAMALSVVTMLVAFVIFGIPFIRYNSAKLSK